MFVSRTTEEVPWLEYSQVPLNDRSTLGSSQLRWGMFLVAVILISVQKMPGALEVWLVVRPAATTTYPSVEGRIISNSTSGPQLPVAGQRCWVSDFLSFLGPQLCSAFSFRDTKDTEEVKQLLVTSLALILL